ncbi:MAG: hypothetical protein IPN17_09615 [Deltaproteobacteria bacterium]|jgi:hypothetical protein|nr:hypothetical protein [Deltaproteobacteria bacterium]MBK7068504.1 hypothetical protein [Deltaproteobacteria bacterium]MBK8692534.1 hypothetical protein [Deltaproteobacteria bacterium]MBP6832201.1 hypothetical protein [Deltaproteobacteria bacterium]
MKHYRSLPTAVYRAEQRLEVVTAAWGRDEDTTLADIARDYGISVALVTKLQRLAREALVPKAPGPKPRPTTVTVETAALPVVATTGLSLDGDRGGAVICTLAVHNGSLRGTQSVFKALGHTPPSRDALANARCQAGLAPCAPTHLRDAHAASHTSAGNGASTAGAAARLERGPDRRKGIAPLVHSTGRACENSSDGAADGCPWSKAPGGPPGSTSDRSQGR